MCSTGIGSQGTLSRGLTTPLAPTLEQLAALEPAALAIRHGSSYGGDGAGQRRLLRDGYTELANRG
ncbi:hypothetical protein [Mycobacteroides abscessus]|uniref:hypothetical protein n=1 Tax=Mycobacteroides abscessus TaxID=36809 RepID=UPI002106ADA6|nr:hypothetical protein [Mycobacteroides abscessus]